MNDFMAHTGGPYRVGGRDIQVAPAFRMVGGMNQGTYDHDLGGIYRPRAER